MRTPVHEGRKSSKPRPWLKLDDYVQLPRALLKLGELWLTDAIVLMRVHYRHGRKHTVTPTEVAALLGCHRVSAWRSLERLRERGWIDDNYWPCRPIPLDPERVKRGKKPVFLEVHFAKVRELGSAEACVLEQLGSVHELRFAHPTPDGSRVPPGAIGRMLGICRDTARDVVKRLASGDTVRSRLATRRGSPIVQAPLVAISNAGESAAPRVRIRQERERITETRERMAALPPANPPPEGLTEATLAMLRRKSAGPPRS